MSTRSVHVPPALLNWGSGRELSSKVLGSFHFYDMTELLFYVSGIILTMCIIPGRTENVTHTIFLRAFFFCRISVEKDYIYIFSLVVVSVSALTLWNSLICSTTIYCYILHLVLGSGDIMWSKNGIWPLFSQK